MPETLAKPTELEQGIELLQAQIDAVPELKESAAVKTAMKQLEAATKAPGADKYIKDTSEILTVLNTSIKKFNKKGANAADIMSGIFGLLQVTSKVLGLLTSAWPGPITAALKLMGSIIGTFGTSSKTDYYAVINEIITTELTNLENRLATSDVKSDISLIKMNYDRVSKVLALQDNYTRTGAEILASYNDMATVSFFSSPGVKSLSSAFSSIEDTVKMKGEGSGAWASAAECYYQASELLSIKILFMLEGLAFYTLADERYKYGDLAGSIDTIRMDNLPNARKYFEQPTVAQAAITQELYRMSADRFSLMRDVYADLDVDSKGVFFSVNDAQFNCSMPGKHAPVQTSCDCVRLTTIYAEGNHKKEDEHRMLTIHDRGSKSTQADLDAGICITPPFFEQVKSMHDKFDTTSGEKDESFERTHFGLTATEDVVAHQPNYSWNIVARNQTYDYYQYAVPGQPGMGDITKHVDIAVNYKENDIYLFFVYPTADEMKEATDKTKPGVKYVIIGSRNGTDKQIWRDNNDGKDFVKTDYYTAIYDQHPGHGVWFFLTQTEDTK